MGISGDPVGPSSVRTKRNQWRLKLREKPVGFSFIHLFVILPMGIEFGLVILVLITILMQFRRKILRIFGSLIGDSTSASCILEEACSTGLILRAGILFFGILFIALFAYTAWCNKLVRRIFQEIAIPLLVVSGLSLLFWSQHFGPGTPLYGFTTIVIAIGMIAIALVCSFYEIVPAEGDQVLGSTAPPITPAASFSLALMWGLYFAALTVAWGVNSTLIDRNDRGVASKAPIERKAADAIGHRAMGMAEAIEKGRLDELRASLKGAAAKEVFEDRAWGKFVLFTAAEASPQALEAVLGSGMPIRQEFVDHALLRMASYGHCTAFDRLEKFRIERGFVRQDSLGKKCQRSK